MTSHQALITLLPLSLYVCLKELQGSFYLQSLGRGWNYDALATLERNLVTLVVGILASPFKPIRITKLSNSE